MKKVRVIHDKELVIQIIPACWCGDLEETVTVSIYAHTPVWRGDGTFHSIKEAIAFLDKKSNVYYSPEVKERLLFIKRRVILAYRLYAMYHWRMLKS